MSEPSLTLETQASVLRPQPPVLRYRATLAYDGAAYQGFQRQAAGIPSIQAAVERAIQRVTGQTVTVVGAGRTDTGVHATGQVIAFDVAWTHGDAALLRALNSRLPDDIALQDLAAAPNTFQPRFEASSRVYRYHVYAASQRHPAMARTTWQIRGVRDEAGLHRGAACLVGRRDFAALGHAPDVKSVNTVRTVWVSAWTREPLYAGMLWTYTVEADAFLQHMVRRMVGMLMDIGRGWRTVAQLEQTLARAQLGADRWSTAPPQGLTLEQVKYDREQRGGRPSED
ncbi:MAG: tRNA pseudouridine(38-40) synthase TruA [Chloroflexota bacterium]|nr:tRNA pseudouridine(38-40) synthase TruA [Chloroflexota bacterium]